MNIASLTWATLFGGGILCVTGILIQISGYFPRKVRPNPLKGFMNEILIISLFALGLVALESLIVLAIDKLPLTSALIAGGLGFLAAPLFWQLVPRKLIDSTLGVILSITLSSAISMTLININQ